MLRCVSFSLPPPSLSLSLSLSLLSQLVNPGALKQAIMHTAHRLPLLNVFEQGAGLLNVTAALDYLLALPGPTVTLFPASLDLTDCPYMWPYCDRPLFANSEPLSLNLTVLNGIGPTARVVGIPEWRLSEADSDPGSFGKVTVTTSFPDVLWPWSGWLGVQLSAVDPTWSGHIVGQLSLTIETYPEGVTVSVSVPVKVRCIITPARRKRVLFDVFHNLRYPSGAALPVSLTALTTPACICIERVDERHCSPVDCSPAQRTSLGTTST